MAVTTGIVQRLKITNPPILAWVYIGPAPSNTEFLFIPQPPNAGAEDAAFRGSMVDALSAAMISGRQVKASHPNNSAEITMVELVNP
jgi:hypothetical protein